MGGRGGYSGGSSSGTEASSIGFTKTYESRNGGSVYTEASRIEQANMNKQERAKYNKEHEMCKHLADNGHNVVHLDDRKLSDGSYDILLNGKKAELKSLKGASNIGREGKGAIKKTKSRLRGIRVRQNRRRCAQTIKPTIIEWDTWLLLQKRRWRVARILIQKPRISSGLRWCPSPAQGEL